MADINLNITDEYIDEMIESVIERRVNSVINDHWSLSDYLNDRFTKALEGKADEAIKKLADETFKEEMAKPFSKRDSYGCKTDTYDTYGDFIREVLRNKCKSDWDLRNQMKRAIEEKVNQAWEESRDEAVTMILAGIAEKGGDAE